MKVRYEDKEGNRGTFEMDKFGRIEIMTDDGHYHTIKNEDGKLYISVNPSTVFKPNGMSITMFNI